MGYVRHAEIKNGTDIINVMSGGAIKGLLDQKVQTISTSGSNVTFNVTTNGAGEKNVEINVSPQPLPDKYSSTDTPSQGVGATVTNLDLFSKITAITPGKTLADFDIGDTVIFANGTTADVTAVTMATPGTPALGDTYEVIIVSVPVAATFASLGGVYSDNTSLNNAMNAKADKVPGGGTAGHVAGLDSNGNLTDTSLTAANVVEANGLPTSVFTSGNLVESNVAGKLVDANVAVSDLIAKPAAATTANDVAIFSNTTGDIADSGLQYT